MFNEIGETTVWNKRNIGTKDKHRLNAFEATNRLVMSHEPIWILAFFLVTASLHNKPAG